MPRSARKSVRRSALAVVLASVALFATVAPAQAAKTTQVKTVFPARSYQLDGVCSFPISATERSGHPGFLTLNDKGEVIGVLYHGSYDTVLSSRFGDLTFTTYGLTSVTANRDGTWTMVQIGEGISVVPPGDPEGSKLVWFTGVVTSVGTFDAKSLQFVPTSQTRIGRASNICEMLVAGLKHRHDTI